MIRRAKRDDAKGIAIVQTGMWRFAYSGIVPRSHLDALSVEAKTETWKRLIQKEDNQIWVSIDHDRMTGFIAGGRCRDDDHPDWDEIYAIYVSPEIQRSGTGTSLTKTFLKNHTQPCSLWVLADNESGIAFYRALGFQPDGSVKEIQLTGETLLENRYVLQRQAIKSRKRPLPPPCAVLRAHKSPDKNRRSSKQI